MNARPFDPHWTTELPSLVAYLDDVCRTLTEAEARTRQRDAASQANYAAAVRAIVLDLYRAHISDPSLEVGIGMRRETLQQYSAWQYGSSIYTPTSFQNAMRGLLSGGFIEKTTNFRHDRTGQHSRTARYQACPSLLGALKDAGACYAVLNRCGGAEGIRLKDCDKELVEYGDNSFTIAARDRLSTINDMLEGHWADLALTDQQLSDDLDSIAGRREDEAAQSFDFSARTVYRVFNNNDWEQGGRFYGAWWMACPSKFRQHILIDGKPTVEVDYSGLHAAMLYAQAGTRAGIDVRPQFRAEKACGHVRWLRPDYLNPQGMVDKAKGDETALDISLAEAIQKTLWPSALPEQIAVVREALKATGEASPEQIARHLKRARTTGVQPLLESLAALGHATALENGRFAA